MEKNDLNEIDDNLEATENHPKDSINFSDNKFTIEYPLNYEEIVNRKLRILEREYDETVKCDIKHNSYDNINEIRIEENANNVKDNSLSQSDSQDEKEEEENNCEYYEQIDQNVNEFIDDEEGFIEVEEDDVIIKANHIGLNDRNNFMEGIEFVSEDKITSNDIDEDVYINKNEYKVKEPEKIKNAMKGIKMKAPKWAEK